MKGQAGGRVPKPMKLVELDGNPGHLTKAERASRSSTPDPGGMPSMPAWMSGEAKAEWKRLASVLHAAGMLSSVDRGLLTTWCVTWGRAYQLEQVIKKQGVFGEGSQGQQVRHPAVVMQRECFQLLASLAPQLGLSYAGRARLGAAGVMPEPDDGPADGGLEQDFLRRLG